MSKRRRKEKEMGKKASQGDEAQNKDAFKKKNTAIRNVLDKIGHQKGSD